VLLVPEIGERLGDRAAGTELRDRGRNATGLEVSRAGRLRAIEYRVRDRFIAEHPGWQRAPLRRRVAWHHRRGSDAPREGPEAADAVAARLLAEPERL
jgi:hypothetical protein